VALFAGDMIRTTGGDDLTSGSTIFVQPDTITERPAKRYVLLSMPKWHMRNNQQSKESRFMDLPFRTSIA
jgi:hypothetical protein